MIYLILFYWIFAGLFCYGVVSFTAKAENKSMTGVFMGCLVMGGILFPIYLGKNLNF